MLSPELYVTMQSDTDSEAEEKWVEVPALSAASAAVGHTGWGFVPFIAACNLIAGHTYNADKCCRTRAR